MQPRREIVNNFKFEHSKEGETFMGFKRTLQEIAKGPIDKVYKLKNKEGEEVGMDLHDIYDFLRKELVGGKPTTIVYETLKKMGLVMDDTNIDLRESLIKLLLDVSDEYKVAATDDYYDDEMKKAA